MNRSRLLLIGFIALLLGAFASFAVYRSLQSRTAANMPPGEEVVIAASDIQLGSRIEDKDVKVVRFPTGDRHGSIALLADRRGRLDRATARARPRESRRQTCAKAQPTHADAPPTISPRRYAGE